MAIETSWLQYYHQCSTDWLKECLAMAGEDRLEGLAREELETVLRQREANPYPPRITDY